MSSIALALFLLAAVVAIAVFTIRLLRPRRSRSELKSEDSTWVAQSAMPTGPSHYHHGHGFPSAPADMPSGTDGGSAAP